MALTGKIMDFFADKAMTIPAFPRTKVKAVSDDNGVGLNVILESKQAKHTTVTCTLTAAGWSSLTQTVSVGGITTGNSVIVTPTPDSHETYGECGVYCAAQASGTLTFKCSTVPSANLIVNVLVLN